MGNELANSKEEKMRPNLESTAALDCDSWQVLPLSIDNKIMTVLFDLNSCHRN